MTEDVAITLIYKAAAGEVSWREALNCINHVTGCWVSQIMGVDLAHGRITYSYEGGDGPPEAIVEYVRQYHQIDPHLSHLMPLEPGHCYHSDEHFSEEEVDKHPFYQDFLIPYGDRYVSGIKVYQDNSTSVILGLHRALGTTSFSPPEKQLIQRLAFHLTQAVSLWKRQKSTLAEAAIGRELLNRIRYPILLLDENRVIRVLNDAAEEYLQIYTQTDIQRKGGYLFFSDSDSDQRLTLAIRGMQLSGQMGLDKTPPVERGLVRLNSTPENPRCMSLVAMRPQATLGAFGEKSIAFCVIYDPSFRNALDPFMLSCIYNLTPAESKVATALAQGNVPKSIATQHNVAISTVRSQIRSLYSKLNVKNDGELISLLNGIPFMTLS